MHRTATSRGKFRLCRSLAVTLFLSCLALQPAFSADPTSLTPETTVLSGPKHASKISTRPFSHLAVGVNVGSLGPGIEAVTTLSRKSNLRLDAAFFNYGLGLTQSGVHYNGNLNLHTARASYDFFPFAKGFRISAGVAYYEAFKLGGTGSVAGGQSVTFNGNTYYSNPIDPLSGTASLSFDRKIAPTVTIGWGNAIPRSGRHLAFPVEIGAAFTGTPTFDLAMNGSACTDATYTSCGTETNFQSDLTAQQAKIRNDISPIHVYPILNFGVTYRFF